MTLPTGKEALRVLAAAAGLIVEHTAVPLTFLSKQGWLVIIFVVIIRWIALQQNHDIQSYSISYLKSYCNNFG
jgi:hypothetical protein